MSQAEFQWRSVVPQLAAADVEVKFLDPLQKSDTDDEDIVFLHQKLKEQIRNVANKN